MFRAILLSSALIAVAIGALPVGDAQAQQPVGVNPGRECQTVRTCNFERGGMFRGCLSSYTCRTCRTVTVRCNLAGRTRCREVVCSWGG